MDLYGIILHGRRWRPLACMATPTPGSPILGGTTLGLIPMSVHSAALLGGKFVSGGGAAAVVSPTTQEEAETDEGECAAGDAHTEAGFGAGGHASRRFRCGCFSGRFGRRC